MSVAGSPEFAISKTKIIEYGGHPPVAAKDRVNGGGRASAAVAMGIFATVVVISVLLIASHDRPFSREISVKPDVLLQVKPE
jgi:hypothetical protein